MELGSLQNSVKGPPPSIQTITTALNRASKRLKLRRTSSDKLLPFIVNSRWKPMKKHKGFRRRADRKTQCSAVESIVDCQRACKARSISKKKKKRKKKFRVNEEGGTQQQSVPQRNKDGPPKYHVTFKRVLAAYRSLRKGRGFHASKRVIWRNRHLLIR